MQITNELDLGIFGDCEEFCRNYLENLEDFMVEEAYHGLKELEDVLSNMRGGLKIMKSGYEIGYTWHGDDGPATYAAYEYAKHLENEGLISLHGRDHYAWTISVY